MVSSLPNRDDPALLRALLRDAQDAYTRLLILIEHSLEADPGAEAEQPDAFEPQIRQLMAEADLRLQTLTECVVPWSERRAVYPADLAAEVERFLALLEKGLEGLKGQIDHRVEAICDRLVVARTALDQLRRRRKGLKGYGPPGPTDARILEESG